MIKLVVFDFDGVVADCKELHYEALNQAIEEIDPTFSISKEEHISTFDGLSTKKKLELLSAQKGLPIEHHNNVYDSKQNHTIGLLNKHLSYDARMFEIISKLKADG